MNEKNDGTAGVRLERVVSLRPCPFCGGSAAVECSESLGYWIECSKCVTTGPTHREECSATKQWNHRADDERLRALTKKWREKAQEPIYDSIAYLAWTRCADELLEAMFEQANA